jgi:D-alanyl-D-alanine carboxypeptidase
MIIVLGFGLIMVAQSDFVQSKVSIGDEKSSDYLANIHSIGLKDVSVSVQDRQKQLAQIEQSYDTQDKDNSVVSKSDTEPFVLKSDATAVPEVTAQAFLVQDIKSGQVLAEKNPKEKRQLASITKLLTAMVILDEYEYGKGDFVPMSATAFATYGGNSLLVGETFRVEDLIKCLLMASSNDSAVLLAETFGGYDNFIVKMNEKAKSIGLIASNFANPHGLDEKEDIHFSNAYDIALLAKYSYENYPMIWEILRMQETIIASGAGRQVMLKNSNELLGQIDGLYGGKTGMTDKALETLVNIVDVDGREVSVTVLGSGIGGYRFIDSRSLIEWTRTNFKKQ